MPVAFVNLDDPVTQNGRAYSIGNDLENKLKTDHNAKWNFVSYSDATKGLKGNQYYAIIVVPEDMSKKIADTGDGKFDKPELIYQANVGKNFTYSRISQEVAERIQQGLNSDIQRETSKVLVDSLVETKSKLEQAANGATALTTGMSKLQSGSSSLSSGLGESADGVLKLENGLAQATTGAGKLSGASESLINGLSQLKQGLTQGNSSIATLSAGANSVSTGAKKLYDAMSSAGLSQNLSSAATGIDNASDGISKAYEVLQSELGSSTLSGSDKQAITQASAILGAIQQSDLKDKVAAPISSAASSLGQVTDELGTLSKGAAGVSSGINQLSGGIAASQSSAASGIDRLIAGEQAVKTGSVQLQSGLNTIAGNEKTLFGGLLRLQSGASSLQSGLGSAYQGSLTLSNGLNSGAQTLNSSLKFSSADMSDFIADPITLVNQQINPLPYNGEGMASYFLSLSLWLGATFTNLALSLIFTKDKKLPHFLWKRYGIGILITVLQSLVCSFALTAILGMGVTNMGFYVLTDILIVAAFFSLIYGITMLLSKAAAPVLFILLFTQIAGCGGTYPIETTPQFYQVVFHFLPMSYSVNILRQIIGGINGSVLLENCFYLSLLIGIPFLVGLVRQLIVKFRLGRTAPAQQI